MIYDMWMYLLPLAICLPFTAFGHLNRHKLPEMKLGPITNKELAILWLYTLLPIVNIFYAILIIIVGIYTTYEYDKDKKQKAARRSSQQEKQ